MQIPMEILSQLMTRTDSGSGVRQRAAPGPSEDSQFGKLLESTLEETKPQITGKKPVAAAENEKTTEKPGDPDEGGNSAGLIAGVMGNQNEVVIILEGEMESATTPKILTLTDLEIGVISAEEPEPNNKLEPEMVAADTEAEPEEDRAAELSASVVAANVNKTAARHTEHAGIANVDNTKADEIKAEVKNGSAAGEVTARTPTIRTSERQGNEDRSSDFSRNSDLSPLENENDKTQTKGQKDKAFPDAMATVRNTAEGAQEPVNNTPPPLSEGIKPEQFRADQQMQQAAQNAPVKADNLFDEMVSRLETMQTEDQRSVTIQLKPEFLGKVELEIAMNAAGLHVKISAMDSGIRGMISGQINALIESLTNKGIAVADVEVVYTGVNNGAFKENKEGQTQNNRSKRGLREVDPAEGAEYYAARSVGTLEYYLEAGVSSVEYSA